MCCVCPSLSASLSLLSLFSHSPTDVYIVNDTTLQPLSASSVDHFADEEDRCYEPHPTHTHAHSHSQPPSSSSLPSQPQSNEHSNVAPPLSNDPVYSTPPSSPSPSNVTESGESVQTTDGEREKPTDDGEEESMPIGRSVLQGISKVAGAVKSVPFGIASIVMRRSRRDVSATNQTEQQKEQTAEDPVSLFFLCDSFFFVC